MRLTARLTRTAKLLAALTALSLWPTCPVQAQEAEWKRLSQEAGALYNQGNYPQATIIFRRALDVAERTFGPDHPNVALSLNNLAALYITQSQYAQAEPLYKRSLAIWEKARGPANPNLATALENYSLLLRKTGRDAEAEKMEARAKAIRSRGAAVGPAGKKRSP